MKTCGKCGGKFPFTKRLHSKPRRLWPERLVASCNDGASSHILRVMAQDVLRSNLEKDLQKPVVGDQV
jgi:hypothetical protein